MMVDIPDYEVVALLEEYGYIVRRIAKSAHYSSAAIDLADLYQVGEIAVLKAIKSYDPGGGTTIKSYVSSVVRNEIFREAARFLGVFTVDHRVMSLAAKVNKLHATGKTDTEIADVLNTSSNRNFDAEHVRDLRIAYSRRHHVTVADDDALDDAATTESTIQSILQGVVHNTAERTILEKKIMGDTSVKDLARFSCIPARQVYDIERDLKDRIRRAIEGVTE